jgi:hypothetical protein
MLSTKELVKSKSRVSCFKLRESMPIDNSRMIQCKNCLEDCLRNLFQAEVYSWSFFDDYDFIGIKIEITVKKPT